MSEVADLSYKVVCFDLDGTLAEPTWPLPAIGAPIPEGVELLVHYAGLGHAIIIHTARPESHRGAIWKWLEANGLGVVYDVICDKPLAGLYVDDRALRFERGLGDGVILHPKAAQQLRMTNQDRSRAAAAKREGAPYDPDTEVIG